VPRPHHESDEEDQRDGTDDDDAPTSGEAEWRGRAGLSGHAHLDLPSDESNEISIEHTYELYRSRPANFQDIFEQVFDHLATRR
jgi:hypothetical protein